MARDNDEFLQKLAEIKVILDRMLARMKEFDVDKCQARIAECQRVLRRYTNRRDGLPTYRWPYERPGGW
jgi:hypothetical protein